VTLGNFMLQAIVLVSGPHLSAVLARGERDRALALYRTATWWLTALSWPFYITAAIFAPLLVQVFGQGFSSGANALSVLAIAMLVSMATGPVTVVLLMGGKSSWNMTNAGAALTVNILLNVILIPRFGITGAAVAWAVSIVVANLAPLAQIWLYLDLHPLGRGFAVVAVGAVLCFAGLGIAAREALGATPAGLAIALGGGMLLYAGLLARFRQLLALPILREAVRMRNRPKANLGVSVG
jgi:O-antigen/teichoic acid export membrane protein